MSFKQRVFNIIGPSDGAYVLGRIFDLFITLLILASVIIVFTVTFDIPPRVHSWLLLTEGVISVVFTIEYLLRIIHTRKKWQGVDEG